MSSRVTKRQTTYWEIESPNRTERIHFVGKEESHFTDQSFEDWSTTHSHPALLDYQYDWLRVFVSTPVLTPGAILERIRYAINDLTYGMRDSTNYFNEFGAERVLTEGAGMLLDAPKPIADFCCKELSLAGVKYREHGSLRKRWPRLALKMGDSYVIAESFRAESISQH